MDLNVSQNFIVDKLSVNCFSCLIFAFISFLVSGLLGMTNSHLSQICNSHFLLINHWLISKTYWALDWGLYEGHSSVLHGSIWIISTIFKSEFNRIHASGINVFFIQNECIQLSSKMKSIHSLSHRCSLYMSHNLIDSSSAAISRLKHVLLQQIFGSFVSQALYLKMRKDTIKIRMKMIIQIVILYDFFILSCYAVNLCLVVISAVGRNPKMYVYHFLSIIYSVI